MHFFSISVFFVAHKVNSFIRKYDHSIKNAVLHIRYPFNKPIAKHKHVQLTCRVDQSTSGVTSPSIPPSIRRCVAQVVVTFTFSWLQSVTLQGAGLVLRQSPIFLRYHCQHVSLNPYWIQEFMTYGIVQKFLTTKLVCLLKPFHVKILCFIRKEVNLCSVM